VGTRACVPTLLLVTNGPGNGASGRHVGTRKLRPLLVRSLAERQGRVAISTDSRAKTTGTAQYTQDVKLPGMLTMGTKVAAMQGRGSDPPLVCTCYQRARNAHRRDKAKDALTGRSSSASGTAPCQLLRKTQSIELKVRPAEIAYSFKGIGRRTDIRDPVAGYSSTLGPATTIMPMA
jgi:hypothetical protein